MPDQQCLGFWAISFRVLGKYTQSPLNLLIPVLADKSMEFMFNIFNQALAQQAHFVIQNLNYAHNSQTMLELPQDSLRTSFTLKIQRIYKIMCIFSWSPWSSNGNQIDSTPDHILAQLHSIVTKYVCMHTDAVLFIHT